MSIAKTPLKLSPGKNITDLPPVANRRMPCRMTRRYLRNLGEGLKKTRRRSTLFPGKNLRQDNNSFFPPNPPKSEIRNPGFDRSFANFTPSA